MGTATWQPKWWTTEHASSWERAKEAMRRDWEQTKNDLGLGGRDLDQDVDDTVKQAAGKDVIPPPSQPNAPGGTDAKLSTPTKSSMSWDDAEQPLMYGYGARQQYGGRHDEWNDDLEQSLRTDWESGGGLGRKWEEVKNLVRRGFDRARR